MDQQQIRNVGILIFDDVEVLDFCGPFEVFSVARSDGASSATTPLFRALTIAEEARTIVCRGDYGSSHSIPSPTIQPSTFWWCLADRAPGASD